MSDTSNPHRPKKIEPYNSMDFIDLNQGVFLGLNDDLQPRHIPLKHLQTQHMEILGVSGSGKTVVSHLIFTQLIQANEGVFFFDSKDNGIDAHLLEDSCKNAGKPFYLLNLHKTIDEQAIDETFKKGGCCYVVGSMRNPAVIKRQQHILACIFQLAESRTFVTSSVRPIAINLDEVKYYLSPSTLEGIALSKDWGVHMLLAHQSITDLTNEPAFIAVTENTPLKLFYRSCLPCDMSWIQSQSADLHPAILSTLPICASYFCDNSRVPELLYGSPLTSR